MKRRPERMNEKDLASKLEQLHPDSYGWALACCDHNPVAAREILQLTYLKILAGKARFNGHASLRTWLYAVIWRTAADQRRRAWLTGARLARWHASRSEPAREDPQRSAERAEIGRIVAAALERLSRRQREGLHLVFYQGLTIDETGRGLGLSPGTARIHYERGKSRLRKLLPEQVRP